MLKYLILFLLTINQSFAVITISRIYKQNYSMMNFNDGIAPIYGFPMLGIYNGDLIPLSLDSSGSINIGTGGRSIVTTYRKDYTISNVTAGAWVQIIASTASAINLVQVFDSSSQTMEFGVGGVGAEVRQFIIFKGGQGDVPIIIPSGSRVSLRAMSGTANTGEIDLNFFN